MAIAALHRPASSLSTSFPRSSACAWFAIISDLAPGWFIRARVAGKLPMHLGAAVESARVDGGVIHLHLTEQAGNALCTNGQCREYVSSGVPMQKDTTHLTGPGSIWIAEQIKARQLLR